MADSVWGVLPALDDEEAIAPTRKPALPSDEAINKASFSVHNHVRPLCKLHGIAQSKTVRKDPARPLQKGNKKSAPIGFRELKDELIKHRATCACIETLKPRATSCSTSRPRSRLEMPSCPLQPSCTGWAT